jgi:isoquinoline 1-oxidoreductase beta subunit
VSSPPSFQRRSLGVPSTHAAARRANARRSRTGCEGARWGQPLPPGTARGLSLSFWNGSFGALGAEVSMKGQMPRVHRAVMAVDCGIVVNPAIVRAQVEGAINYGLAMALTSKITIDRGRVQQSNFYDYTVLRQEDVPKIEVAIVKSNAKPSGIGELGTPPIAPAIANAVFTLTGKRARTLPFSDALA